MAKGTNDIAVDVTDKSGQGAAAGSSFGPWGALIGGAAGGTSALLGGIMGSDAEEAAYKRRKQAYDNMIKRATGLQTEGEQAFNNIVNNPNPYLNQVAYDMKNNQNDVLNSGRNQLNAALTQQGLRGGQAATQLARGIGNMTNQANQDLNQMMYSDSANNRQLQAAYNQAKALAGINASLQQFQG